MYEYLRGVRALMNCAPGITEVLANRELQALKAVALVCADPNNQLKSRWVLLTTQSSTE
jgi:hypothetical protein